MELELADGAAVRLELAAAGEPAAVVADGPDLPEGLGRVTPVGRGGRAAALATGTLRSALSPLGPLLQEIHHSVTGSGGPVPQELTVEFGVQIGQDLKLGVVGAGAQATMTVTATWHPAPPQG
ncbi:hypothetical protein CRI70_30500 [Streptomyces sp. Ru87]|nr:hypothetical protein CRI70_30500 [Streptomyces sp. Ru87]